MEETSHYKIIFMASAEKSFAAVKDRRIKTILAARIDKLIEEPEKQGKPLSGDLAGRRTRKRYNQGSAWRGRMHFDSPAVQGGERDV